MLKTRDTYAERNSSGFRSKLRIGEGQGSGEKKKSLS